MSAPNDHDLLLKLNAKLDSFYEEFRRVSNGAGFPRCAERLARLDILEKNQESLKTKFWWAITTSIVSAVSFISTILIYLVKGAMDS